MSFSTDEINTGVPELLDRIGALERKEIAAVNEVRRLLLSRSEAKAEGDSARALLRELVKAAHVITDDRYVDEWGKAQIDDDDLVALEDVLRRVQAEAGEENAR